MFSDSVDKIIDRYIASMATQPFAYSGQIYEPYPIKIHQNLVAGFTCPEGCGGCCFKFTLDYLPSERHPYDLEERQVNVNYKDYSIFTDYQQENDGKRCKHLRQSDGRCNIHGFHPFSCDFELIRFHVYKPPQTNMVTTRLYGRGWAFDRTDGGKGAKCEIIPPTRESIEDTYRKMARLKEWADYFEIPTSIDEVLAWIKDWSLTTGSPPLHLSNNSDTKDYDYGFFRKTPS